MKTLVLASASPRRIQFLKDWGFQFVPIPANLSETPDKNLTPQQQILQIARSKAEAVVSKLDPTQSGVVVLSADTEVVLENELLGKPANPQHAREILKSLSGRRHLVITGIYIIDTSTKKQLSHIETSEIFFKTLTDSQIDEYVATGEPLDKAGAYGIQGKGQTLVESSVGSYENIVGLPKEATIKLLKDCEIYAGN